MSTTSVEVTSPVVAPVTRREVLHRAADLLEEFGWGQGYYGSKKEGWFCAIGAIDAAADDLGYPNADEATMPMYAWGSVTQFNDAPGRTKAEVVARLREAAEASA